MRNFSQPVPGPISSLFFFFNDPATTEIYTLPLHDALPISHGQMAPRPLEATMLKFHRREADVLLSTTIIESDRKSTRLNSSHLVISYAVFCLKKKKKKKKTTRLW